MNTTMLCPIRQHADTAPHAPALLSPNRNFSYAEADLEIRRMAWALRQHNVRPGQVVGLLLPLSTEYVLLFWALLRVGAMPCPLNPAFPPAFLREQLAKIAPAFLITDQPAPDDTPRIALQALHTEEEPEEKAGDILLDTRKPATLVLTSGSGGAPKAAVHNLAAHFACAANANRNIPLQPGDCWLLSLPIYHIAGMATLFRCFLAGAAVALPRHRAALPESLAALPVTHVSLVAAQLQDLLRDANTCARLKQCRAILLGGAAIPAPLISEAFSEGMPIHTTYGLTEMASQVCTTPPCAPLETLLTSGLPLAPGSITLDADGLIRVGGDALFLGYWQDARVEPPQLFGGCFTTGDLGHFDAEGRLHVLGRRDNMFTCGGENIQPETVEAALCQCVGVVRAVCVPAPDARLGQVPVAFVEMQGGLDSEALEAQLRHLLPKYALPRVYHPWPDPPQTGGIKIQRSHFLALAQKKSPEQ